MTAPIPTTIGLGRLVELVIRSDHGQRLRVTPRDDSWLAWNPATRDLIVLRPADGTGALVTGRDAERHRRFHGAPPDQARCMEWPAPRGPVRTLGLIESVTYAADGIRSPSKKSYQWIHQFGDRGKSGHGHTSRHAPSAFSTRFLPQLTADASGNLFVLRRPSNRFTVRDWIIG